MHVRIVFTKWTLIWCTRMANAQHIQIVGVHYCFIKSFGSIVVVDSGIDVSSHVGYRIPSLYRKLNTGRLVVQLFQKRRKKKRLVIRSLYHITDDECNLHNQNRNTFSFLHIWPPEDCVLDHYVHSSLDLVAELSNLLVLWCLERPCHCACSLLDWSIVDMIRIRCATHFYRTIYIVRLDRMTVWAVVAVDEPNPRCIVRLVEQVPNQIQILLPVEYGTVN